MSPVETKTIRLFSPRVQLDDSSASVGFPPGKVSESRFSPPTVKPKNATHVCDTIPVKPIVDNKAPRTYLHCHLKMKKIQLEQERYMEIEKNNRLLAYRIAHTMARGGLDNWNEYQPKPSVNAELRNRELVKISLENQAILKRINMTKSVYDHKKWLGDFK
ncbi:hypothetical protein NFI96_033649, partial [Prochilodus magdalenae]